MPHELILTVLSVNQYTNFQLCYVNTSMGNGNIVIMNDKIDTEDLKKRFKMKAFW